MFELFKEIIKPAEQEVIEETVEDNTQALLIAGEIALTMIKYGDRVQVTEGDAFEADRMGKVIKTGDKVSIQDDLGDVFVVEKKNVVRLVSDTDLLNEHVDVVLDSFYSVIKEALKAKDITDETIDMVFEDDRTVSRIHSLMADHTLQELSNKVFLENVANDLLKTFPKLPRGIIESPKRFSTLLGD